MRTFLQSPCPTGVQNACFVHCPKGEVQLLYALLQPVRQSVLLFSHPVPVIPKNLSNAVGLQSTALQLSIQKFFWSSHESKQQQPATPHEHAVVIVILLYFLVKKIISLIEVNKTLSMLINNFFVASAAASRPRSSRRGASGICSPIPSPSPAASDVLFFFLGWIK